MTENRCQETKARKMTVNHRYNSHAELLHPLAEMGLVVVKDLQVFLVLE